MGQNRGMNGCRLGGVSLLDLAVIVFHPRDINLPAFEGGGFDPLPILTTMGHQIPLPSLCGIPWNS